MRARPGRRLVSAFLLLTVSIFAGAEGNDVFEDPFAVSDTSDSEELDMDFSFSEPDSGNGDSDFFSVELDNVDSLFQGGMLEEAEDKGEEYSPEEDLLFSEGIVWEGRISGSIQTDTTWDRFWTRNFDLANPLSETLTPSISSTLYFDARPDPDFRAFGKIRISSESDGATDFAGAINTAATTGDLPEGWTREENEDGDTIIYNADGEEVLTVAAEGETEEDPQTGAAPAVSLEVQELFSDFSFDDRYFFRFGKHTIKWGVGYFFSPADVLNLTAIDVEDPTADREGPVSLKVQYPFGLNNLYFYVITNTGAKPLEVAIAPKIEVVYGSAEIAIGGFYQKAVSPRVITTVSATVDEVDVFGEGVVTFGSDRVFVRRSRKDASDFVDPPEDLEIVLDTFTVDSIPIFTGTLGLRYLKDLDRKDMDRAPGSLVLIGQYFYNGEGYADSSLLKAASFLQQNPDLNGLALEADLQPEGYEAPPDLAIGDLTNWGRHYLAGTAGWNSIFESDIGISVFGLINVNDLSGILSPNLSFRLLDTFDITAGLRMTFGNIDDEYTNPQSLLGVGDDSTGASAAFSLSVSLGSGSF